MDISDIVSTEFKTVDAGTPVSKLLGAFEDRSLRAVVVMNDDEYQGLVTRRQLSSGHHAPDEKACNLVWHVAKVSPDHKRAGSRPADDRQERPLTPGVQKRRPIRRRDGRRGA